MSLQGPPSKNVVVATEMETERERSSWTPMGLLLRWLLYVEFSRVLLSKRQRKDERIIEGK